MLNNYLVSIIIPVYNVEKYLSRCINSLLSQTYSNIEIVIVDDGSTDNSGRICDNFAQIDKRIIVCHKQNGGLSSARNEGIKLSKGDYISFVDADDYVLPNYISSLLNLCVSKKTSMSACCTLCVHDDGTSSPGYYILPDRVLDYEEFINTHFDAAWAKLYKRSLFDNMEFPVGKKHEDQYIYARVAYEAKQVATSSQQLYMYYKGRNDNISNSTQFTFESEEARLPTMNFLASKNICLELLNETMVNLAYIMVKKRILFYSKNKKCYLSFKKSYLNLYRNIKNKLSVSSRIKISHRFLYFIVANIIKRIYKISILRKMIKVFIISFAYLFSTVNNNQVILINYLGSECSRPYEELINLLISKNDKIKIIFAVDNDRFFVPKNVVKVKYKSTLFYKYFYSSRVVIYNVRNSKPIFKRKKQFFLQLWHGMYNGGKKVEKDAMNSLSKRYIKFAKNDGKHTDLMISSSKKQTELFLHSFWYKGPIFECGGINYAHFFNSDSHKKIKDDVFEYFGIPKNKKLVLFAPTFRNTYDLYSYDIDFDKILNALIKKTGQEFVILFHYHKNIPAHVYSKVKMDCIKYFDANSYDISLLELACDLSIGDYSSVDFEVAMLGKPVFRYANDLNSYMSNKGFYIPLNEQPFPYAIDIDSFIDIILNFKYNEYAEKCRQYINQFGVIKNSNTIIDLSDLISNVIKSKSNKELFKKYKNLLIWPNS